MLVWLMLRRMAQYARRFGPVRALRIMWTLRRSHRLRAGTRITLPLPWARLTIRTESHDVYAFGQVFLARQYALPPRQQSRFIIDGGAHIGCAAIDFAVRYPGAQILAVEADRENYELLTINTRTFANIRCVHGAVWPVRARVRIANPHADSWSFRCEPGGDIQGFPIGDLADMLGAPAIDILKLDVEGAEREIFSAPDAHRWLARARCLLVELHDDHVPGCSRALMDLLSPGRWATRQQGETCIVQRV